MLSIDLQNAVENPTIDNFTVLLFRLLFKSDAINRQKLSIVYGIEVMMAHLYQRECIYKEGTREPDYKAIEEKARKLLEPQRSDI